MRALITRALHASLRVAVWGEWLAHLHMRGNARRARRAGACVCVCACVLACFCVRVILFAGNGGVR
jgi:hypothetical protein